MSDIERKWDWIDFMEGVYHHYEDQYKLGKIDRKEWFLRIFLIDEEFAIHMFKEEGIIYTSILTSVIGTYIKYKDIMLTETKETMTSTNYDHAPFRKIKEFVFKLYAAPKLFKRFLGNLEMDCKYFSRHESYDLEEDYFPIERSTIHILYFKF